MTREEVAVERFANGYNCAQSVFSAFSEDLGLDAAVALKIANGFGGGVRCGEVCGAVTGAIMAISLKHGFHQEKDFAQKGICNGIAFEFIEKFRADNGSIICRDLLGMDIQSPEDFTTQEARAVFTVKCPKFVASAVQILTDMELTES